MAMSIEAEKRIDKLDTRMEIVKDDVSDIRTSVVELCTKHCALERDVNRVGDTIRRNYADLLTMIGSISDQLDKSTILINDNAKNTDKITNSFNGVRITVWVISVVVGFGGVIYGFLK